MRRAWIALTAALALAAAPAAWPAEAEGEAKEKPVGENLYVPLEPSFVTNFGDANGGRLKFVKADVSLKVTDPQGVTVARYHLPALRNVLVLLLSSQDEASVSTSEGREALRAEALVKLRDILAQEEGEPYIEDVLFTNFIVQR